MRVNSNKHSVTIRNGKLHCTCAFHFITDDCRHVRQAKVLRERRGLGAFIAALRKDRQSA